jgi:IclR family acetate operon transcriptional repressor
VLRAFEAPPHVQGIADLSRALGLSKGTVHLLAKVLEAEGFLEKDEITGKYQVGPAVGRLVASTRRDLTVVAREPMQELYAGTSFPVYLAVLIGDEAVIVERAAPTLSFLAVLDVGARIPMHCSALGKALLGHQPVRRREELLDALERKGLQAMTPATITTVSGLRAELEAVVRSGVALDREESLPGVFCAAAAVWDAEGGPVAAVSVAAPAGRVPEEGRQALVELVRRTAGVISYRLGHRARTDEDHPAENRKGLK